MGRKKPAEAEPAGKKKRGRIPFTFLGHEFESIDTGVARQHMIWLILAVIIAKFLIAFITTFVFQSFVDSFDIGIYLKYTLLTLQGVFPYTSGEFQYPVLAFIPMMIAAIPALLFQNAVVFLLTFQALMVICDIVIILCVYLICLKLWDEKTAFLQGFFMRRHSPPRTL